MTYPQQPGNWSDPNWQAPQPAPAYPDPQQTAGYPSGQPTASLPEAQPAAAYPDPTYQISGQPAGAEAQPASAYPTSGYPASGYPAYGYPTTPVNPPTNGMAIASLVLALVGIASCITAPVGAILGHIARRQIRERGEGGDGMALAGIIIGWILTGLLGLLIAFYVVIIVLAINSSSSGSGY
ncbi:DUF4190 domain-containing protein [Micromonospora sp. NPDC049559]|uniref:DUF4190 domain-containing protein n=1 Tax=Micromonospora sp. NPDC049559 TaxID=3155923 RepID=UPI0034342508